MIGPVNASPYNELENVHGALLDSKSDYRVLFVREKCVEAPSFSKSRIDKAITSHSHVPSTNYTTAGPAMLPYASLIQNIALIVT
jgi:hypothetical protein